MRQTAETAETAAARVSASPRLRQRASAKMAGSGRGARPAVEMETMRATTPTPSVAIKRSTASAFSTVSALGLA